MAKEEKHNALVEAPKGARTSKALVVIMGRGQSQLQSKPLERDL